MEGVGQFAQLLVVEGGLELAVAGAILRGRYLPSPDGRGRGVPGRRGPMARSGRGRSCCGGFLDGSCGPIRRPSGSSRADGESWLRELGSRRVPRPGSRDDPGFPLVGGHAHGRRARPGLAHAIEPGNPKASAPGGHFVIELWIPGIRRFPPGQAAVPSFPRRRASRRVRHL